MVSVSKLTSLKDLEQFLGAFRDTVVPINAKGVVEGSHWALDYPIKYGTFVVALVEYTTRSLVHALCGV